MDPTSGPRRHRWCLAGLIVLLAWLLAIPLHTICHETGHALTCLAVGGHVNKIVICGITVYPQVSGSLQVGWRCGNGLVGSNMPDELWKTDLLQIMGYGTTTILSYLLLLMTRWVGRIWQVALLTIALNFALGVFLHMGQSQIWGSDPPELQMGVKNLGLPQWILLTFLGTNFVVFHWLFIRAVRALINPLPDGMIAPVKEECGAERAPACTDHR